MNAKEFNTKQLEKQTELLKQAYQDERNGVSKTQTEKDIFNLKYIRYGIKWNSPLFRDGTIGSLDRAIKLLEQELKEETTTVSRSTGWDNPPKFNSLEERDLYYK